MYDADDVYRLLSMLNLEMEISQIQSALDSISAQVDSAGSGLVDGLDVLQRSLVEMKLADESGLHLIGASLETIAQTLGAILEAVSQPKAISWPPVIGQVVMLENWNYPNVVKGVEIEDGVLKYFVGASTRRDDERDALVSLDRLLPYDAQRV